MKKLIVLLCPVALSAQTIKPYIEHHLEHGIKTDSIVLVDNEKENIYETPSGRWFVPVKTEKGYKRIYIGSNPKARKKAPVLVRRR